MSNARPWAPAFTRFCVCLAVLTFLVPMSGCAGRRRREARQERSIEKRPSERRDDRRDKAVEKNTRWEKLGERVVTGAADRDVIPVGIKDGTFKRIKVEVEHSALAMHDIVVHFANGETFSPKTRLVFGKNTKSRTIDLPGARRVITKVVFRYSNLPGGGRAQVELWGKK